MGKSGKGGQEGLLARPHQLQEAPRDGHHGQHGHSGQQDTGGCLQQGIQREQKQKKGGERTEGEKEHPVKVPILSLISVTFLSPPISLIMRKW